MPGPPGGKLIGQAAGDDFGRSVASAGDVNGDGYDDVIVGATGNDAGGTSAGRAYVYYGGPLASSTPDLTLTGEAASDQFGQSVASAGDVNGDGYDDVIVGATGNDAGGTSAGRAYVYYGGPLASSTPDLTLTGEAASDQFGQSVASAGDVNGDGYADVIVGAYLNDAGGASAGRAYVYYGGPAADATPDLTLTGEAAGDQFGFSVASAGDVNGDGYADLVIGATRNDAGGADAGRAYVYYGGPAADATPDLTLTGEAANDQFGRLVAGAGDVNGDGYADVIIGAYLNDAGGTDAGRAYVYFGGASPDAAADLIFTGEAAFDHFGFSVASAGDVDGDGYADVVVGAIFNDAGGLSAGRAYVYYGGPTADATADLTLTGEAAGDNFGYSVAGAGDVNGDGYGDVIVGAYLNDAGASNAGRATVYFGGPAADATADLTLTGEVANDFFGISVASAGDVDGDGLTDLVIGAFRHDTVNGLDSGAAYLVSNANTGDGIAEWRALGEAAGHLFGTSVAGAGDVNGDGYDDVIVGAISANRTYVYYGGPGADATADLVFTGEGGRFGFDVAGAGDVNGDGYDDVLVGAVDGGGTAAGRAYVYFGGPSADANPDLVLDGEAAQDDYGISVAGAGDVNGDGYADIIVGAEENDAGGTNAGRAYVYFGGPTPDATADLIFTGQEVEDEFGRSVDSAGDVDGDGYDDLLVGAEGAFAGGGRPGRAYVYFGGPAADATPDLIITGEGNGDNFGISVAGAGDIDGDGYADLIVGADGNDAGGDGAGRAYVYFGGPDVNDTADLVFTGEAALDLFGNSVAGAGDVDGDGYADLVVGADGNDAKGTFTGRAYVYFGGPSADATADLTLTGEAADNIFGTSVASAGDTNGDGRADLVVGASRNDAAGTSAGAAYLYRATGPAAAPGLYRVADVPGDQGGRVQIRWTRSDQETQGNASAYRVERSEPPGASGYAWEPVATVAASGNPRYSLSATTFSDQTDSNSGVTCFRVTAESAFGEQWRSMVKCGASIDNLAPPAPAAIAATASSGGNVLVSVETLASPPPDLAGYTVYRSADATCELADTEVGLVADDGNPTVSFEDGDTAFGTDVFYCATATDVHGNQSPFVGAASANPAVLASVKLVLQGAYQSGLPGGALMRTDIEDVLPLTQPYAASPWAYAGPEAIDPTDTSPANGRPDVLDAFDVVDWVLVEIRSDPLVSSEQRAAALLLADGTLLDPATSQPYASVAAAAPGAYHVAVYHRSHLAAMTAFAIGLDGSAPGSAYDLSASASFVYGSGGVAELASGVWGLFAADGSGDGLVTAPDFNVYSSAAAAGATGYRTEDYTLDGLVTAPDFNLYNANAAAGAATAVPEN